MIDARTRALRNRALRQQRLAAGRERQPPPARPETPRKVEAGTYVYDPDYDMMVPKAIKLAAQRNWFDEKRSDLPSPAAHPGGMPEIKSMADGKRYETKRNYYKSVARAGCEIVGHDKDWQRHVPKPGKSDKQLEAEIGRDVQKAWEIEAGKVPSYGPQARRLMRKQRRAERATV